MKLYSATDSTGQEVSMKYLFWRGHSLWCRFPVPGMPERYPLGIRTTGSRTDRRRCLADGERALAALRTKQAECRLFDKKPEKAPEYNPKFWRLAGRYWYNHLRFTKTGKNERYHLIHSLRRFGRRYAKEITRADVERWRYEMRESGASVNAVNNRYAYLKAVFGHSAVESDGRRRMRHDPTAGMKKLPGGRVRQFVLTADRFERNFSYLQENSPRFALFYLALWETGRRPREVAEYTWEMIHTLEIDGVSKRMFMVPPEITKTDEPQPVPISRRLWAEVSALAYRHGIVFRNRYGDSWRHYKRHMAKLKKVFGNHEAGWARDTRRGFVTHKTEVMGFDPEHVRMCTGHKTDAIFRRYRIGKLRNMLAVVETDIPRGTNFGQMGKTA